MEEIIKHYLAKIMVTMPVEIVKVDEKTSLCDVRPLIYNDLQLPLIVKCPFLPIGNGEKRLKFKVKPGQRFIALFSQLDLSNYISNGTIGQVNSTKMFSFTNAVILPIEATTEKSGCTVPKVDFDIVGDIKIVGNIEIIGDIKTTGRVDVNGEITSTTKVQAPIIDGTQNVNFGGISGVDHTHSVPTPEHKVGNESSSSPEK